MKEDQLPKIHCTGCTKTLAVDDKDRIEIKCPRCGKINILDKGIHSTREHIKNK